MIFSFILFMLCFITMFVCCHVQIIDFDESKEKWIVPIGFAVLFIISMMIN